MARFMAAEDQKWESAQQSGLNVEKCPLWEKDDLFAGIFKLPKGFQFPHQSHRNWVQIFVLSGQIRVELDGEEARSIRGGGCYFVEPGDVRSETVEEDLTAIVIMTDLRECWNQAFV